MSGFLSLIFLLVAGIALLLTTWALWCIVILVFARRKKWLYLAGLPAVLLVDAAGVGIYWRHQAQPAVVFEREFDFAMPADTLILSSDSSALGDSGSAHLHLRTSTATLNRMLSPGYAREADTFAGRSAQQNYSQTTTGSTGASKAGFSSERRRLTYDPATGEAWYTFEGVD